MGSFKLGKMTLRSLFGKPETVMYPLEKRDIPAGHRGTVEIDMAKCILCGICVKRCPCSAIEVDKAAGTWSINHFCCIQCDTCPKGALSMSMEFPHVAPVKTRQVESKPEPTPEELAAEAAKKAEREARIVAAKAAKAAKAAQEAESAKE